MYHNRVAKVLFWVPHCVLDEELQKILHELLLLLVHYPGIYQVEECGEVLILGPPAHILHMRLFAALGACVGVLEFLSRPAESDGHKLDVVIYRYHRVSAESLWFLKSYLEV